MSSSLKNYIHYVQNVLGVKKVFYKSSSHLEDTVANNSPESAVRISAPLIITVDEWAGYSAEENELLNKMIAALKMKASTFQVIDKDQLTEVDEVNVQKILHFVDEPGSEPSTGKSSRTYSPRRLLKEPALKKEAWAVMQNVVQKLQIKT